MLHNHRLFKQNSILTLILLSVINLFSVFSLLLELSISVVSNFLARIGSKATCPISNGNVSKSSTQIDLKELLQDDECIHFAEVDAQYLNVDDYKLMKKWSLCLCSSQSIKQSAGLDQTFNTLIDKSVDAQTLMEELVQNQSLKVYIIDSLKRYHGLMDIIHILPSCSESQLTNFSQQHQTIIESFLDIKDTITKSVLLTSTIDSMSYESQRYLGNFIKKNDLPIPFAYYMWNQQKSCVEYKINFNLLAEVMCLTTGRYILQVGSESAIGMGKTSMLQFIFPDKRVEALNTDGSSTLRNGCIDVLFSSNTISQKNESYIIFDVHGTINAMNEDIITSIQEYCALQIFYVTQQDLKSSFLNSMMNYSRHIQAKLTIVVIFYPNYDDKRYQAEKIINAFQLEYQNWKHVTWTTAPPTRLWYQPDSNKTNKDLARSQRLLKSFNEISESMDKEIQQQIYCTSIFSIQSYYTTVKTLTNFSPSPNARFEIQTRLKKLFNRLNDTTGNLRIATPVSYLDSAIKQCERELLDSSNASQTEIHAQKEELIQQRSRITTINDYTAFFIDLLTKRSYIELLITDKYLENWRSKFESTLLDQSTNSKTEALKLSSEVKQLEERLAPEKNLSPVDKTTLQQKLCYAKEKYNEQRTLVTKINKKLTNIDLTIGLFCDEIMALYDFSPHIFDSNNLIQSIAKTLVDLMLKGFAIHILRGRPLHCHSQLIKESIKFIQTTQQPPLVLTVIGEQSSAKSSLMNSTFGCNFRVSAGRCTIGMYMSIIQWKSETIVIFDTEGLLSLEEAGSIFDNQMVTMAVLSSHLVLINHKGEFSSNLKDLIGMSFYAKLQIQSPIKPKLLFVLRDQADLKSKTTFFRQLTELKEQLQNDSKFLKTSIDDELDINNENVYLLPNAIIHDVNPISNISQCWRNQTFPKEIIKLRNVIFDNIISTTKPQKFQLLKTISNATITTLLKDPQTPTIDPAYTDMAQLYTKISSNWETIDRLGPQLLECKTLYELSIMKELQTIAYEIIKKINVTVYEDGEKLIDQTLLNLSENNFIDVDRDRTIDSFSHQLNGSITRAIDQAQINFNDKTERSCYIPEIKSKVSKRLEPPIRSAQHLLKEMFGERLNNLLKTARVDDAQQQLLNSVQKEFDQNKSLQLDELKKRVETSFQSVIEQHHKNLQSSVETETKIIKKILTFYNEQLQCFQGESTKASIYNLLYPIMDGAQHKQLMQKFETCLSQSRRQAKHQIANKSGGVWKAFKFIFTGPSDIYYIDSLWTQLKDNLGWFTNNRNEIKNKKVFTGIWNGVLQIFEEDLLTLINNTKSFSSNPNTIQHLFQFIGNAMNSQCITNNYHRLEKHILCSDLAVIGLNIIINGAITKEKEDYELNRQNSTNEIKECQKNLLKQITAMKDALELGRTLAETIGKQIIDEIGRLLQRRIEKEITEDIFRSQFINHEAIQKQAYEESISQANGENILKYVYDINRYFIELSLREIKTTVYTVTHQHILHFKDLIMLAINKAGECAEQHTYSDTGTFRNGIRNGILDLPDLKLTQSTDVQLFHMFSLNNIVCMPIIDEKLFKQGFSSIRDYYKDIDKRVDDLTKDIKAKAFVSCKQSIAQKLGCQIRCPGCGAKCCKLEPHEKEEVEVWQDPCKKCPPNNCTCEHSDPILVQTHETTHHLASAFNGKRYHKIRTPCLELCYQRWTTTGVYVPKERRSHDLQNKQSEDEDEYELVFPNAKYYNEKHPAWYNDLKRLSTEGSACKEKIPPPDQRRAWMVARHTLVNRYKHRMVDNKEYDEKLYPVNVESLPADFEPKWKDKNFE